MADFMNKTQKVSLVYIELKKHASADISDIRLLQGSEKLVNELFKEKQPKFVIHEGRNAFEFLSLEHAYDDGGWRVFEKELSRGFFRMFDDWEGVSVDLLADKFDLENIVNQIAA
tara:strand:- start:4729 stop:5073 length:345 start_codon:yes stop_codon:yes gene_type:complete